MTVSIGALACALGLLITGCHQRYAGPFELTATDPSRPAKVFLPTDYDAQEKWPMILMLHGYTSNADEMDADIGLSARVTAKGFILLAPDGTKNSKGDRYWNATDSCCDVEHSGVDDVGYLLRLVDAAVIRYKVDVERIYIFGKSNGGYMANRLLCETDHTFAGAVSVAGSTFKAPKDCRLERPVTYLQVHAVDDPLVEYEEMPDHAGGKGTAIQRARAAGCIGEPVTGPATDLVTVIPGDDTTPSTWDRCERGVEVALWTIRASSDPSHQPHSPRFRHPEFVDSVIDFLFRHRRP